MWRDLKNLYAEAARFARARPLLFLVPVAFELAQHIVEWRLGMFEGIAQAKAVADGPWRMGFGTAKVLALVLVGYWMPRWLARQGVLGDEHTVPAASVPGSYWPLLAYQVAITLGVLWGAPALARAGIVSQGAFMGSTFVVETVLALSWSGWMATAPIGRAVLGPIESSRLMARHLPWAFAFWLLALLPPIVAHYALNYLAFGAAAAVMWGLVLVDVAVVGYLALLIAGVPVFQIRRALNLNRG